MNLVTLVLHTNLIKLIFEGRKILTAGQWMQHSRLENTFNDSMKIIERALASENLPSIERNILLDKLAKAYEPAVV